MPDPVRSAVARVRVLRRYKDDGDPVVLAARSRLIRERVAAYIRRDLNELHPTDREWLVDLLLGYEY